MYAIVDIETTGGFSEAHRITEIAVMVHNGYEIVDEFQSLINPGRPIPGFIRGLTGIDDGMVKNAPAFSDISSILFELLKDKIFVAHNVNFDYNFLRQEFFRIGKVFNRPRLCTVRLGRKIYPGLRSYSLGRICEHAGITIRDRHRAFGDAEATAHLFGLMLGKDKTGIIAMALKRDSGESFLPPHIAKEKYEALPEQAGVYYFHDAHGKVIYIGKAVNIKSRFKSHFSGGSKSNQSMKSEICDISYELTGSDFLAMLLESLEIKRLWPKFNRAQKVNSTSWGIYQYEDVAGYRRFQIAKTKNMQPPEFSFTTHAEAWSYLLGKINEYHLCPKLCGIQKSHGSCYSYQENKCQGACCGQESTLMYNEKIDQWLGSHKTQNSKILIREKGRDKNEQAAILFDQGLLSAYGFIDKESDYLGAEGVIAALTKVKPVPETRYILKSYLTNCKADFIEL